jgi:GPH family glycoside/pentoside/hexuronide:cation symporter
MFFASITTAALIPLFWFVPAGIKDGTFWLIHVDDWLGNGNLINATNVFSIYLTLLGLVFFTSFTFWSMPYYGMQLELTPNYDERTRLTAWMTFFGKISSLIGSWILALVILVGALAIGEPKALENTPVFFHKFLESIRPWLAEVTNPQPGEKPIVVGMRLVCWFIMVGIVIFGMLPALFVKERYYNTKSSRQAPDPFWQSMRESATCKPLWSLILISFFLVLGSSSVSGLGQYLNFYYVFDGDLGKAAVVGGLKGTVIVIAGIASIPFFTWLGEKYDKRTVVMTMLSSSMAGHLLNYFLMTPEYPYLQLIPGVFESSAIAAVWLFIPSMKADVSDHQSIADRLRGHQRLCAPCIRVQPRPRSPAARRAHAHVPYVSFPPDDHLGRSPAGRLVLPAQSSAICRDPCRARSPPRLHLKTPATRGLPKIVPTPRFELHGA